MLNFKKFYSKLLLFGEYSIIKESNALAVPYPLFEGQLKFKTQYSDGQHGKIDSELKAFAQYLKQHENGLLNEILDVDSFDFDIGQGLYFHSSIPQGYGVGSSGALVAAVFDNYLHKKNSKDYGDIDYLKSVFAKMECHFHGASSGIDPLISFLEAPIKIIKGKNTEVVSLAQANRDVNLFLANTGRPRRTEPLVNLFLEKLKSQRFSQDFENILVPSTNKCIDSFLNGKNQFLLDEFKMVSKFQYEYMQEMIPKLFQPIWKKGLDTDDFYLKLCGAGGGGFILGISNDPDKTKIHFGHLEYRSVKI